MNDHIDEIPLRFLNHSILILSAISKINAYKKFKNHQFAQTNVPEISCFFLLEKVSTCGK